MDLRIEMLFAYLSTGTSIQKYDITVDNDQLLKEALWIDLFHPTAEDKKLIETTLEIHVPTREQMQEIEISSRLYKETDVLYMTANMVANSDTDSPQTDAVTFIVSKKTFITVRYLEPQSFRHFNSIISRLDVNEHQPLKLFVRLLETTVDRIADILERINHNLDELTQVIFKPTMRPDNVKPDFQATLRSLGSNGDLGTKIHQSLTSFKRLLAFFKQAENTQNDSHINSRQQNLSKDIDSLSEHVTFQSNKVNFLLDATLGMINIEQNNIIKIFSVAAVIFLPPTLIASFYGMNFQFMPELQWRWGYPLAMGLMLLSAWLPYKYFKYRKWL